MVADNGIVCAGCWAHLRGKIIDAEKTAPEIAREAIEMVRAPYAVEKQARTGAPADGSSSGGWKKLTSKHVSAFDGNNRRQCWRERFLAWKEQLLPKHPMTEAIDYALGFLGKHLRTSARFTGRSWERSNEARAI